MNREHVLVDGYNFIHQVPEFKAYLNQGLEVARENLIEALLRHSDFSDKEVWVIFDSKRSESNTEDFYSKAGFRVVYTSQRENADTFIERTVYQHKAGPFSLRVVSSDRHIQNIALGKDVTVSSPDLFYQEMKSGSYNEDYRNLHL